MDLFFTGLVIGFSIAAPVGPIGILTIQRSLNEGRSAGFVTGLGAATADGFYGLVAGLGLSTISVFLISITLWLQLIGGCFLLFLGWKIMTSTPPNDAEKSNPKSLIYNYISMFIFTITNPATILIFLSVFSSLNLHVGAGDSFLLVQLVVGVFIGSASWWLFLSFIVSQFSHRIGSNGLRWINRGSGVLVIAFGCYGLGMGLFSFFK